MHPKNKFPFLLVFSGGFWQKWARNYIKIVLQLVHLQKQHFNALEGVHVNTSLNDLVEIR
jgi:hypothetical protein